ncbi:alpha-D-glucose phosphate-specific phosphoglucomutase [Litoribrevibacter euphylliae]|uniref:phosphoglucomutase (alpha-D-glucose-1,6-bisphosphate-dependent) n=1 Tax=Litoribrevibacter euphylliae TaxID=1834034 RepID=A0ABV7HEC6_9GAMM
MQEFEVVEVASKAFSDQKPGTSGLRKKVQVFQQEHYLENFVQSFLNVVLKDEPRLIVIGGDGRFFNLDAIQTIVEIAVANEVPQLLIARDGILSTPAASHWIRKYQADAGIILSASHNPAGENGDFGIKFNGANGAPAPEALTTAVFETSKSISSYKRAKIEALDLTHDQDILLNHTHVVIRDGIEDYVHHMAALFDFDALRDGFESKQISILFDAMNAVTGPYAKRLFLDALGADETSVINAEAKADFGGGHPDPNLVHAAELVAQMNTADAPVLGAASDGDGDRNLILGKQQFVSPSDSLAVLLEHHKLLPQFSEGILGVARSMPTSTAVDRVAESLGIDCYETPTGWKFFGNLLDDKRIQLCGEESFGTGSDHVREKDGLWAVLAWLTIVNSLNKPVAQIMSEHWQRFGRSYYCRYDFEGIASDSADEMITALTKSVTSLADQTFGNYQVKRADIFEYTDPVDASEAKNQGVRVFFTDGSRVVYRLSGTGTVGATLRVYLEQYQDASGDLQGDAQVVTQELAEVALTIAKVNEFSGRTTPDVIT